jgi:hypothetical protein
MRWKRTIAIWSVLVALFSLYNIPANALATPKTGKIYQDSRVLDYNFSLTAPFEAQGNFTVPFTLERPSEFYAFYAYFDFVDELRTYSALGSYKIDWTIFSNGERILQGSYGNVWFHYLYGVRVSGSNPDRACCALIKNFTSHAGENIAVLKFAISSNLTQHGEGSNRAQLGPFVVEVGDRLETAFRALALEGVVAVALLPCATLFPGYPTRVRVARLRTPA